MKVEDFENFCAKVIDVYIEQIHEYEREVNCNCLQERVGTRHKIFKYYQRKRDEIKNNYMEKPAKALDRHKIAACMMYAILRARALRVNRFVPNLPEQLLMANEYLAVYVGINIVEQYRKEDGKTNPINKLIFPITYHEKNENGSEFLSNLCKGLYYQRLKIKSLDIFAYSNIFFFLEKYTDTKLVL